MTDLSALENLLSSLAPGNPFKLDSRSVQDLLEFVERYAQLIPFSGSQHPGQSGSWADVLFMDGNTPQVLAQLYENRELADGDLYPQQALLLAFVQMLQTPQALLNYLPHAHRDMFYRQLLGLKERAAEPPCVALTFALSTAVSELLIPGGTLFAAGQDRHGTAIEYALDQSVLANHGEWSDLRYCYIGTANTPPQSRIVYDQAQDQAWPSTGLRLFSEHAPDPDILDGRLLISSLLAVEEGVAHTFTLTLAEAFDSSTLSAASISGGKHWLPLQWSPSISNTLVFTLPEDADPITAPINLDGLTQDVPVLKWAVTYGLPVPSVTSLSIDGETPVATGFEQYVLTPFGYSASPQVVDQNQLFLGFAGLEPGQTLSLYWKLQGSSLLAISWEYLNQHNQWASLDAMVIDDTAGLFRSGCWSAILPEDASATALSMPSGRYWLRALMGTGSTSTAAAYDYPIMLGLHANSMTATVINPGDLDSVAVTEPLPAHSITQPSFVIPHLASTDQPWSSWGGRAEETRDAFFQRAAQRLGHRNRALTWQDMVDLLKTQFRVVYDVVVPPSTDQRVVPAPLAQQLVVIPFNTEKDNADPLRPIFHNTTLEAMESYLEPRTSPWQNITVANPSYRDVLVEYRVIFLPGVNIDYGYRQLELALQQRYMPWVDGHAEAVTLANRLDYYEMMAAIQEHPLIERVDILRLDGGTQTIQGDSDEVLILQITVLS